MLLPNDWCGLRKYGLCSDAIVGQGTSYRQKRLYMKGVAADSPMSISMPRASRAIITGLSQNFFGA